MSHSIYDVIDNIQCNFYHGLRCQFLAESVQHSLSINDKLLYSIERKFCLIYRFSTAVMNSLNVLNGVPWPQSPKRTMYAIFLGSDAPVADAYTTRAFGNLKNTFMILLAECSCCCRFVQYKSIFCNSYTKTTYEDCSCSAVKPVFVGLLDPVGHRFFALWHSSKITHPSKSDPHHCSSCFSRDLYLLLFPVDSLISAEYVLNITPFLTFPLTVELIFAYLSCKGVWVDIFYVLILRLFK